MVGCMQAFSGCSEWGLVFIAVHALLSVVASLVAGHRLSGTGSVVVVYGSSCSVVSGECVLLGSVSSQQRFGVTDIKAPPPHQRVTALGFWTDRVMPSGLKRTLL